MWRVVSYLRLKRKFGGRPRMAKRTDSNQTVIVKCLRKLGCSVQILSDVGKGCPDIVVGYRGRNFLFEIKDGEKPPSARKLTEYEQYFFDTWNGQVCIINSTDEVNDFFINEMSKGVM